MTMRHQRFVAAGKAGDSEHVNVVFDGVARHLARRLEERPDIDIEAEVGEGRGDNLGAAVVAILPHFGHQDSRATAFRLANSSAMRRAF